MTDPATDPEALTWETCDSEVDYRCPGFDVVRDEVVLPDGTETEFHYVHERPSVVILPFTPDGEVVVIEEWRQAVKRVNGGLPAGGTEPGDDDLEAAARRELAEETGYEAESMEKTSVREAANGATDITYHYFVARGCTPTAERNLDHNESIHVETVDFDELREAAVAGDLRDGRSALAVLEFVAREGQVEPAERNP